MNTDTTDNGTGGNLQGAFGDRGTRMNAINYGHPYGEKIIEDTKNILRKTPTGNTLVQVQEKLNIPLQIMKGQSEAGYSPEMNTIFLYASGKTQSTTGEIVFDYIKSTRQADLEYAGHKTPDPMEDLTEYAGFMHGRNVDTLTHVCKVLKELTNSSYFPVLLDTLTKLGFNEFNKAYLDGANPEELYEKYAQAYEQ